MTPGHNVHVVSNCLVLSRAYNIMPVLGLIRILYFYLETVSC